MNDYEYESYESTKLDMNIKPICIRNMIHFASLLPWLLMTITDLRWISTDS
jgi:hypothetical protein